MDDPPAFTSLSHLLTEDYGFREMNDDGKYVYFSKADLPPIQVNSLKISYTDLELSSYAIQVDECVDKFINRFAWVMETLERLLKKDRES